MRTGASRARVPRRRPVCWAGGAAPRSAAWTGTAPAPPSAASSAAPASVPSREEPRVTLIIHLPSIDHPIDPRLRLHPAQGGRRGTSHERRPGSGPHRGRPTPPLPPCQHASSPGFQPSCDPQTGLFAGVQCEPRGGAGGLGEACHCVDAVSGVEEPGTRGSSPSALSCSSLQRSPTPPFHLGNQESRCSAEDMPHFLPGLAVPLWAGNGCFWVPQVERVDSFDGIAKEAVDGMFAGTRVAAVATFVPASAAQPAKSAFYGLAKNAPWGLGTASPCPPVPKPLLQPYSHH